ncbi:glycosyltransferase family 4 protein [Ideonella aquatica]|nr:glycosyltransferase family 1 protein [Ideonella aquatica]
MLIGGRHWTGGYNYLLNLVQQIDRFVPDRIRPVLFFGDDLDHEDVAPFERIESAEVVISPLVNAARRRSSLMRCLLSGRDPALVSLFGACRIDVAFENAQFLGWRWRIPTIAWIPDFQHLCLPHLFTRRSFWQRELGFQAQVRSGRLIMLSSEDALQMCEAHYPGSRGRTEVARFAIWPPARPSLADSLAVAAKYGLTSPYVFMPNQFWKHKNHRLVIEALSLLKARGHRVMVAASGRQLDTRDAAYFPSIESLVKERGVSDEFRLLGMLPYADLAPLMRASVALLNPSLFEGWSTTVEEARALGVPMLLSDLDVHKEQAGAQAMYFDRCDAGALADALMALPQAPLPDDALQEAAVSEVAKARSKAFAQRFAEVAERAAAMG